MSKPKKIHEEEVTTSEEVVTPLDQEQELERLIQEEEVQSIVIDSEESAKKFYKDAKYEAPEGVNFAYVTSDKNVFWPENGGSAKAHAFQNKLQIFKLELDAIK
jgi:uroporphyrinogen-III synthase